ncbi:MAG: hypothetical protein JRI68_22260 [Deltaproteobacteria bacterium]|nr:hypothetical protein [Deltaproteobacteria bacterium]
MAAQLKIRASLILIAIGLAATVAPGCGDSGYEDCVSNCEAQYACLELGDPGNTCKDGCERAEESSDDHGCDGEWADYQECLAGTDGCDPIACPTEINEWQSCEYDFCRDNPNEPDCMMDSAS